MITGSGRAGTGLLEDIPVIVRYGDAGQFRLIWTSEGITAFPALMMLTSMKVESPSTPPPLNPTLLTWGFVDWLILIFRTRSVENSVVVSSSGFLSCR